MAITTQGNYTGLLGYDRDYEYLGDGNLPFRIVEKFTYEVFDTKLDQTEDLSAFFKTQFSNQLNLYSGDLDITSLDYPNSPSFNEDGVRLQKYNVTVEARSSGAFHHESSDGYENTKNSGLAAVVGGYFDILKGFSETFKFSMSENGEKDYDHSLNFSLRSGDSTTGTAGLRTAAKEIAEAVFNTDAATNLSVISFPEYTNFAGTDARQYVSETFDDLAHSYSFNKTKEILPFNSGTYTHSMDHSLNYGEDGYFKITESLISRGKLTYDQALVGFNSLVDGSSGRCAEKIAQYSSITQNQTNDTTAVSSGLNRIKLTKVFKVPELTVEGTAIYSNDPKYLTGIMRNEKVAINREQNGVIKMDHSFDYKIYDFIDGETDSKIVSGSNNIVEIITGDRTISSGQCQTIYDSLTGITGRSSSTPITLLSSNVSAPERGKGYSAQFSYTDNPIYNTSRIINPFTQSQVTGFKSIEVSVNEIEPKDIIEEYKIVNRNSKQSVLSYGYQQEPGSTKVSCKTQIVRPSQNLMEDFYLPSGEVVQLLKFSKAEFLNHVMVDKKLYNYFLQDGNYTVNSDNSLTLDLNFVYTKKR